MSFLVCIGALVFLMLVAYRGFSKASLLRCHAAAR
jgi:hypothetical protein